MSLADYAPEIEEITIPARHGKKAGSFNVRGLSFHDISKIIRVHYHDLDGLFDLYQKTAGEDLTPSLRGVSPCRWYRTRRGWWHMSSRWPPTKKPNWKRYRRCRFWCSSTP
ncbi:hypothetical protein SP37_32 [Salmonella phage 37]|uniref:Uncharacterized protein n=1 Tax=Salmonella phage 37 TaxID=1654890 RepID=A0A0N6WGB2_9CAUD|nr:tail length tape measure protein [Salmonella phage 37]AKJ73899.1 hypothetical protein SP37_32 [Salmonella phage 37]